MTLHQRRPPRVSEVLKYCVCGSPICGKCQQCIEDKHPKRPDGSIIEFGSECPFPEAPEPEKP